MRTYEILAAFVGLLILIVALRWGYTRAIGEVTDPDDAYRPFPVTTPIVRELCPGGGSDCLIMPAPDFRY